MKRFAAGVATARFTHPTLTFREKLSASVLRFDVRGFRASKGRTRVALREINHGTDEQGPESQQDYPAKFHHGRGPCCVHWRVGAALRQRNSRAQQRRWSIESPQVLFDTIDVASSSHFCPIGEVYTFAFLGVFECKHLETESVNWLRSIPGRNMPQVDAKRTRF